MDESAIPGHDSQFFLFCMCSTPKNVRPHHIQRRVLAAYSLARSPQHDYVGKKG